MRKVQKPKIEGGKKQGYEKTNGSPCSFLRAGFLENTVPQNHKKIKFLLLI